MKEMKGIARWVIHSEHLGLYLDSTLTTRRWVCNQIVGSHYHLE